MAHSIEASNFDINAIGDDFIKDPYPTLHELREKSPVHFCNDGSVFLTRYDDCVRVYRSRDMLSDKRKEFGKKFGDCPLKTHHTTSLVFNDPPYHTTVRKLISEAFTPRKLAEMEPLIEAIVHRLLDRLEDLGECDLVADFAKVLPTEIISFMLGIPESHRNQLRSYSLAILGALDPVVTQERMDAGNQAVVEFGDILLDLIKHRREHPGDGGRGEVLESLIFGNYNGRSLTDEELVQNCIFLLNAGHETTTSLVGNSVGLLLQHPNQHLFLRENPQLINTAVEEFLRLESPLQIGNRMASEDIDFGNILVPAGTYIHTSIAGANRDPDMFPEPDRCDITRKPNRHIAFITGIHVCLGATLARMEGRIAIGNLVRRFPRLRGQGNPVRLGLARFRGFTSLPVSI